MSVIDGEATLESDEPAKPPKVRTRKDARSHHRRGGKGRNAPGSPRSLAARKRAAAALETRLEGKSWREVARIHKYSSGGTAYEAVMLEVRDAPAEAREELRSIMDMQIDKLLEELWPRFLGGELEAGRLIIRAFERRAKLLGLDAITDADYVAIASVQGLLGAIFDAALRLLPTDKHAAFLEEAQRTLAQLEPGARGA